MPLPSKPIKIGFVGTFSGSGAAFGEDMYDAFMLLVERNGGKLGGVPVQVIRKDSQFKPEVANQVVDELLDRENVSIIVGVTFSNEMLAIYQKVIEPQRLHHRIERQPVAARGRAVLAVLFQHQRTERSARRGGRQVHARIRATSASTRWRRTTRPAKTTWPGFKRYYKPALAG